VFARNFGGGSGDAANGLATNGAGLVYITGTFNNIVDFDPSSSVSNLVSSNSTDVFVAKYLECAAVTATVAGQTNVLCNSLSTGAATVIASGGSGFTYTWTPTGGNSSVAVNLAAGNYSVDSENSCGSKFTQTVTITQPPVITLTAIGSSTAVCVPNTLTLSSNAIGGTGTITYSWTNNGTYSVVVVSPTASAIYTISATDANNCVTNVTVNVFVTPGPNITTISSSSVICVGQTATLTANGALTYTWNATVTNASIAISPSITTTYTVNATDITGCTNVTTITQSVSPCTGLDLAAGNNELLTVYPNPTNGKFKLSLNYYGKSLNVNVYNALGQLMISTRMGSLTAEFDFTEFNPGVYFITLADKNTVISHIKLIKN
jgi:hypothetical protein